MSESNQNQSEDNRFKKLFDEARYYLKYWDEKKQVTVRELAVRLEQAGMPIEVIASEMARELEGYVTAQYIDKCLDDKYKRKYQKNVRADIENKLNIAPKNVLEDKRITIHTDGSIAGRETEPASYEEEVKQAYEKRTVDNNQTQTYKLDSDLITRTEHDKIVKELSETINKLVESKNKDYQQTQLYKDQQLQIEFQRERIHELEEIETKTVRDHGFTSASAMAPSPNRTTKVDFELGFDATMFAKFFMACRNCKTLMYLQHDGKNIVGWRDATAPIVR